MEIDWLYGLAGGLLIGLAAAVYLHGLGFIAGISGILGGVLNGTTHLTGIAFLAGLIGVPAAIALAFGAPAMTLTASPVLLVAGGLAVGIGTRMGAGCTSGHGVCGLSRLSPRSVVATGTFMVAAALTVFVMRHVIGVA